MTIKLTDEDKIKISRPDDLYDIMQRILLRENEIDIEKEHFWIIGLNAAGVILYIELVSLGSVRATLVEPMNVFRVAILKGAVNVMAVHNHPSRNLEASEKDKDITDRLIQVGKILDIQLIDHLIITTTAYMSFVDTGLMSKLEQSLKYVPPYLVEERIREQKEKLIQENLKTEKELKKAVKTEQTLRRTAEKELLHSQQRLEIAVTNLLEKQMTIQEIAVILDLTPKEVEQICKKEKG